MLRQVGIAPPPTDYLVFVDGLAVGSAVHPDRASA
jgi:hypothetical protein